MTFAKNIQIITILILTFTLSTFAINTASPSANGQKGVINVLSPEPMGIGRLSVSLFSLPGASSDYKYNFNNQSIQGAASTELEDYLQTTTHLSISYGLTEFIDLNLRSSFAIDSKKHYANDADKEGQDESYSGISNLEFGMKYSVLQNSFFNMGINVFAHLPVSGKIDDEVFFGEKINGESIPYRHRNFSEEIFYNRKASYGATLLASIGAEGMRTYLNLGYLLRHSEEISDALKTGLGLEVAADQVTTIFGEFNGEYFTEEPNLSPMRIGGGLKFNLPHETQLTVGAFAGLSEEAPAWQGVAGISWSKVVVEFDSDNDGIPDKLDKCPEQPEDMDGFEDMDGCPDNDNDQDGIADINDKCPNEPEDADGFEDEDGCPDFDNDQDGILDIDDKCPDQAEDVDGFEDIDGCPDYDNDGDLIPDSLDKCPAVPEDMDGFEDEDGCPENDNDQDGIIDELDKCPNQAETINDFEDEDGCPDAVILKKDERIILENIYFKSGKAELTINSYTALDHIKRIFIDNPNIKVQIEGHTDSQGSSRYNLKLSQLRANAVSDYLIGKFNIPRTQIKAVGFGEDHPITSNNTKEGRAQNRRIEFKVLSNR